MRPFLRHWFAPAPDMAVSLERVNREFHAEQRRELAGDVAYRDRVKRRMAEGRACRLPPLFDLFRGAR